MTQKPPPATREAAAQAAWSLFEAATAAGDYGAAIRALRTSCELLGQLGTANTRRRVADLSEDLRAKLKALASK